MWRLLPISSELLCGDNLRSTKLTLRGKYVLPMMALTVVNVGFLWSLVICSVSCYKGHGDRTRSCLQMEAAKGNNHTPGIDHNHLWVARIDCLCTDYFETCYLMFPNCLLGNIASLTTHILEPHRFSLVEIHSWTLNVNKMVVNNYPFNCNFKQSRPYLKILKVAVSIVCINSRPSLQVSVRVATEVFPSLPHGSAKILHHEFVSSSMQSLRSF